MEDKLIIVMVGLPARGKSYITKKISNYLNWLNINNKIFNVGNKRRLELLDSHQEQNADFFDPNTSKNVQLRDQLAISTLDDLLHYIIQDDSKIGIFDATNSTQERRAKIIQHIDSYMTKNSPHSSYNILFLESICNDLDIIEKNMALKLNGPDYASKADKSEALLDFKKRLQNYEHIYESISSSELNQNHLQYIKIINIHNLQKFNITGVYSTMLLGLLQNYNTSQKKIWLSINDIDYQKFLPFIVSNQLIIMSENSPLVENSLIHKRIPKTSTLDQIHDLILDLESSTTDILIQTQDQFLINGLFKYFKLQHPEDKLSKIDLQNEIICINPEHYRVGVTKIDLHDLITPELMTRSNSSVSTVMIDTPDHKGWDQFNYQNLNIMELNMKLELLK